MNTVAKLAELLTEVEIFFDAMQDVQKESSLFVAIVYSLF